MLVGSLFTALVQSSSATTGIVIVLAERGPHHSRSRDRARARRQRRHLGDRAARCARQAARRGPGRGGPHGVQPRRGAGLAAVHRRASPTGSESIGGPLARQIANAHTIFNVANTLVFLAFVPQLERLVDSARARQPRAGTAPAQAISTIRCCDADHRAGTIPVGAPSHVEPGPGHVRRRRCPLCSTARPRHSTRSRHSTTRSTRCTARSSTISRDRCSEDLDHDRQRAGPHDGRRQQSRGGGRHHRDQSGRSRAEQGRAEPGGQRRDQAGARGVARQGARGARRGDAGARRPRGPA